MLPEWAVLKVCQWVNYARAHHIKKLILYLFLHKYIQKANNVILNRHFFEVTMPLAIKLDKLVNTQLHITMSFVKYNKSSCTSNPKPICGT
jgi:hypothetical protein